MSDIGPRPGGLCHRLHALHAAARLRHRLDHHGALPPVLRRGGVRATGAALKRDFRTGLTMPLVANVPIMVFVIVLADPIVALLNPGLDPRSVEVSASSSSS